MDASGQAYTTYSSSGQRYESIDGNIISLTEEVRSRDRPLGVRVRLQSQAQRARRTTKPRSVPADLAGLRRHAEPGPCPTRKPDSWSSSSMAKDPLLTQSAYGWTIDHDRRKGASDGLGSHRKLRRDLLV